MGICPIVIEADFFQPLKIAWSTDQVSEQLNVRSATNSHAAPAPLSKAAYEADDFATCRRWDGSLSFDKTKNRSSWYDELQIYRYHHKFTLAGLMVAHPENRTMLCG